MLENIKSSKNLVIDKKSFLLNILKILDSRAAIYLVYKMMKKQSKILELNYTYYEIYVYYI